MEVDTVVEEDEDEMVVVEEKRPGTRRMRTRSLLGDVGGQGGGKAGHD